MNCTLKYTGAIDHHATDCQIQKHSRFIRCVNPEQETFILGANFYAGEEGNQAADLSE